jgi:O-succinylbenzoate synthase
MEAQFQFRLYSRRFKSALATRSGIYSSRIGILIRLETSTGTVSYGEVAPIPWFPHQSFDQVLRFCDRLPQVINETTITTIPAQLPAAQFGFEAAWQGLNLVDSQGDIEGEQMLPTLAQSGLLSPGELALHQWQDLWKQGYRTLKWKIGQLGPEQGFEQRFGQELEILQQLRQALPPDCKLRLDANGKLNLPQTKQLLTLCDRLNIEFLEQPLPPNQLSELLPELLRFNQQFNTPIALDESVATLEQLRHWHDQGWRGIFVVKAAIAGYPSQLRQFCQEQFRQGKSPDLVFSSVFETAIGHRSVLKLAQELGNRDRAMGLGVSHWLEPDGLDSPNLKQVWQHCAS